MRLHLLGNLGHDGDRNHTTTSPVDNGGEQSTSTNSEKRFDDPAAAIAGAGATGAAVLPDDSAPPDGGYGWICCIAFTCINGATWGNLASYGVYLSYYINHDDYGGTPLAYSFIGGYPFDPCLPRRRWLTSNSINFAAAMLSAPAVNILTRRYGTHAPMVLGCFLWLAGWLCASWSHVYYQLFLSQGLLVGLGAGLIWLPPAPIIPQWFLRRRSLAQGIASSGSGIVGVIYAVATTPMIENLSLPWALRITGITSFVMLFLSTILIRDRNNHIQPDIKPFDTKLIRQPNVLLLCGYTATNTLGYMTVIYSFSAFAVSLGYSQEQGGNIIAILNAGTAVGRPLIGVTSDYLGRITTACVITGVNALLAFAFWIPVTTYAPLVVLAFVYGGTCGVFWATIAPVCAEVVPLNQLASLLCLQWLTVALPSLFAQAIALEIRSPGSERVFLNPQIYTGAAYAAAAVFLLVLRKRKVGLFGREKHR